MGSQQVLGGWCAGPGTGGPVLTSHTASVNIVNCSSQAPRQDTDPARCAGVTTGMQLCWITKSKA